MSEKKRVWCDCEGWIEHSIQDVFAINDAHWVHCPWCSERLAEGCARPELGSLAVGDVVQLRSGGPTMTVSKVSGEVVAVVYFEGINICDGSFLVSTLQPA